MTVRQTAPLRRRRRLAPVAVTAALLAVPTLSACGSSGGSNTVHFFVFNEASFAVDAQNCNKQAGGKYTIQIETLPNSADQQREQLVRRLAAKDSTVDILGMDVIWTAEFAEAGWIEPWQGATKDAVSKDVLKGPLTSGTYNNQLYAAPFTSNTELLWYRKSRVPTVPTTWDQLISAAEALPAGQRTIQVQGNRYEGYMVWFNALVASAGGQVVTGEGTAAKSALGDDATVQALTIIHNLATSTAADPSLSTSNEGTALLAFQTGASTFMINYPFVYPGSFATPDVFKDLGWARYPAVTDGMPSKPPLGGINLGVGAYSKHKDLAFEAATCLASDDNQLNSAKTGGLPPTRSTLYDQLATAVNDTDIDGNGKVDDSEKYPLYPFADDLKKSIDDAAPRPVTPRYNDVSLAVQRSIHPPASIDPKTSAAKVNDLVQSALEGKALL